jgi:hypothetical protein
MALLVAALIAPVASALSIDTSRAVTQHGSASMLVASMMAPRQDIDAASAASRANLDAVKLLAVGTVYFGLAALVRRTIQPN